MFTIIDKLEFPPAQFRDKEKHYFERKRITFVQEAPAENNCPGQIDVIVDEHGNAPGCGSAETSVFCGERSSSEAEGSVKDKATAIDKQPAIKPPRKGSSRPPDVHPVW